MLLSTSMTTGASDCSDVDTYLLGIRSKLNPIPFYVSFGLHSTLQKKCSLPDLICCSNISSQDIQSIMKFQFNCRNFAILISVIK